MSFSVIPTNARSTTPRCFCDALPIGQKCKWCLIDAVQFDACVAAFKPLADVAAQQLSYGRNSAPLADTPATPHREQGAPSAGELKPSDTAPACGQKAGPFTPEEP